MTTDEAMHLVMARFDFDRVARLMGLFDWRWDFSGQLRTPSPMEIEQVAYDLLCEAVECFAALEAPCSPRKGGLVATCSGEGRLRLEWVVEEWDSEHGLEED